MTRPFTIRGSRPLPLRGSRLVGLIEKQASSYDHDATSSHHITATAGVVAGPALGARELGRLPRQLFRRVVAAMLIVLGLYMALGAHRADAQSCVATRSSLTPVGWVAPRVSTPGAANGALELVADVALPGPANRFDYQSIDPAARRLYISHMDAGRLVVFDLDSARVVADVGGLDRATGVWAVPVQHAVYVSAAGRHELVALDDRTLKVVGRVGGIRFPDGIAYAPTAARVFVSDESGQADISIDARTMTKRRSIDLGGEAGNTHYDSVSRCILVAVQTRNQLVAIDPASERVVARYDLPGVDGPHGFIVDDAGRRAFITGEGNGALVLLDLRTMRITQRFRVGDDPDVIAWDSTWQRLYVASESGVVSTFVMAGESLRAIGTLRAPHAHTVAVDPRTHRVYLPLENVGGKPLLRILAPASAPQHHSPHG